jgi:hypothetical protein
MVLVKGVSSRLPPAHERTGAPTRVVVALEDVGEHSRAHVTIRSGEALTERRVPAGPCSALLDAIALIIVLALEGGATAPVESVGEPESKPATPNDEQQPGKKPERRAVTRRATPASKPTPRGTAESEASRWQFHPGIHLGSEARTAASPTLLLAGKVGLETRFDHDGWFSPSVRVEASYGVGPIAAEYGAPWDMRLELLRLLLCPVRHLQTATLRWRACLDVEAGQLAALSGARLEGATEPRLLWLGAGASVALEVVLARFISFEFGASSVAMFSRGRFVELQKRAYLLNEVAPVAVGLSFGTLTWIY